MSDQFYVDFWEGHSSGKMEIPFEGHCDHKAGSCTWDTCSKCKEKALHKFMIVRGLKILDVEKCENCKFLTEERVK